ncbi:MAG: trypsin-like peptidase domain-containing protein [Chloroherpetonaceae bacterium]|nr:S1C family serine protease [Chthonomonadaceae bacterium]MDW8207407.1 trypsin-like peptidase domain-containing protein [Chloroherpetonaceae bacterium]
MLEQLNTTLTQLVQTVRPAVVSIEARTSLRIPGIEIRASSGGHRDVVTQYLQKIQKDLKSPNIPWLPGRTGTGFLLQGGHVVTTYDVVARTAPMLFVFLDSRTADRRALLSSQPVPPEALSIILDDGTRLRATRVHADPQANVAVVKVDVPPEKGLRWGDSSRVVPGNLVLTIGNQEGFSHSAALGMVAGVRRSGTSSGRRYDNLIQFQGAVGAGGSGSPLLNLQGEVIGMVIAVPANTPVLMTSRVKEGTPLQTPPPVSLADAIQSPLSIRHPLPGGMSNMGFAIPSSDLHNIVERLQKNASLPRPGWIGIQPGLSAGAAVSLLRVYKDQPADRAGIRPGDQIIAINGTPTRSLEDVRQALQRVFAGQTIRLELKRGTMSLSRTLVARPKPSDEELDALTFYEKR